VWDAETRDLVFEFAEAGGGVTALAFSGEATLVAAGLDGHCRAYSLRTFRLTRTYNQGSPVFALKALRGGGLIFSASQDGAVHLWDVAKGALVRKLTGHGASVRAVDVSHDGAWVATASFDKTIRVWNLETGACRLTIAHNGKVYDVAFSPTAHVLAAVGAFALLSVFDLSALTADAPTPLSQPPTLWKGPSTRGSYLSCAFSKVVSPPPLAALTNQ
jgi:eukaryotic-like serine/threonine-protein kinase